VASTTGRALIARVPVMECKIPTRIGASAGRKQAANAPAMKKQASKREKVSMG